MTVILWNGEGNVLSSTAYSSGPPVYIYIYTSYISHLGMAYRYFSSPGGCDYESPPTYENLSVCLSRSIIAIRSLCPQHLYKLVSVTFTDFLHVALPAPAI